MIYLDTNIFLYASDKESINFKSCEKLLKGVALGDIEATTSGETIQEIMHYFRSLKKDQTGLQISRGLLKLIPEPLESYNAVIYQFLNFFPKYSKPQSRDLFHLAVCVVNDIGLICTYDGQYQKFAEVKAVKPDELLGK